MKQVLMVAYYFPPIGGPGVYRSAKFCKYLPGCGWRPLVIAGGREDPDYRPDETLLPEIPPEAEVRRIDYPHHTAWRRARAWLFDHHLGRAGTWIGYVLDFPCRFRGWARLAAAEAERCAAASPPRVVFTSAPPFSAHLVGLRLKRRFRVPWVADFRDPWVGNPILMKGLPRWQAARHARAERTVAREADRCVFAHPLVADQFAARHRLPEGKALAITNGYDPDDFRSWPPAPAPGDRVDVVHVGSFYGDYSPAPLRRALEEAARRRPALLQQVRLVFVGGSPVPFDDLPGLQVEVLPRVSHVEAVARMRGAHVLLIVYPGLMGPHHVPGKLFEYLAARRPVLALCPPEGSAARIIRETRAGCVADPDRPAEALEALESCLALARNPSGDFLRPDDSAIRRYARPELTRRLADLFDEVAGLPAATAAQAGTPPPSNPRTR